MAADDGAHKQGLPMDVMLEIAWGTDPETVVRCAATCKELRRHIFGSSSSRSRRRLRLRRGDRLVPSLLGGQLIGKWGEDLYVEDKACNLIATGCFHQEPCMPVPIAARDGLVLVHVIHGKQEILLVCNPATGQAQSLPPGPDFAGQFVLLVGNGEGCSAVGRPFKVLNVASVYAGLVNRNRRRRLFEIRTFSSERGTWGPPTWRQGHSFLDISCSLPPLPGRHLVVGDSVYWVSHDSHFGVYYVFKLDVSEAAGLRLESTTLPPSFHRECDYPRPRPQQMLLVAAPGGSPVVLLANDGRISAWTMSDHTASWTDHPRVSSWTMSETVSEPTASWKDQPHVVVEYEAIRKFGNVQESLGVVQLEWFAEMRGVVQLSTKRCGLLWLHLQSRKIIRHFPGSLYTRTCPYDDLSSWVPTLSL
ncbi:unnamed protein product [Urochloa decumbens]|uniref:DUF7595 domain-containing protein n=1 Tax=Urochloa decumbens TaxID=240449 RepID=A0ABC8WKH3_9POAL